MRPKRIFLIHATPLSIEPINEAFARLWPEALLSNLLDDSLTRDLSSAGSIDDNMQQRFLMLAHYAEHAGADGILFTCSAFGQAIDLCKREIAIPVLKPNEAMIDMAISQASRIAIVATFPPSVDSMTQEFQDAAVRAGRQLELQSFKCPYAMEALRSGDKAEHDKLITDVVSGIEGNALVCFAQFSMASAAVVAEQVTTQTILTTPDSAVLKLRALLDA